MRCLHYCFLACLFAGCQSLQRQRSATAIPHLEVHANTESEATLPSPIAAKACWSTAEQLAKKGYLAESIIQYEKARQYDPNFVGIARKLGVLYAKLNRPDAAKREFEFARALEPNNADLWNDEGYFYLQQQLYVEAKERFEACLQLDPMHRYAHVNLGTTLAKQGQQEAALQQYEKVLSPGQAKYNLAVILAGMGESEQAQAYLLAAQQLEPTLAHAKDLQTALNQE